MKLSLRVVAFTAGLAPLSALVATPCAGQIGKVLPVDEADQDPSFFTFRARLLVAVVEHDAAFIYSVLAENVSNDFGGGFGIADFKKKWRPEEPESELWSTLGQVLSLGGQFYRERDGAKWFAAPYVYSVGTALPSPNLTRKGVSFDPFQYGVIIGQDVRVRQEPRASSPSVTTLSFDVVRVTDWAPTSDADGAGRRWIAVRLEDGTPGYVAADYVLHRAGYRAGFERRAGRWVLRWLIAGD